MGFGKLHPQFKEMGIALVGVSKDSIKAHQKFIADHALPFTLLSDPDASVMTSYGAFGEKVQYGKTTMGAIRSTLFISPDGKILKHWGKVAKAAEHPEKVLEFVRGKAS